MYLLYSDESGDPGRKGQGDYLILSALLIHEGRWRECFDLTKQLRTTLKQEYGIAKNAELHANKNIAGRGVLWGKRWKVEERVKLFQIIIETVSQMPGLKTMSVCIRKSASQFEGKKGRSIHDTAWTFILQRFHNFIVQQQGGNVNDHGIVLHDTGHDVEIRKLMRKLRVYNYVPSRYGSARNVPLTSLIEDPIPRNSAHAQFIQIVDYIAYSLLRRESPVDKYPGLENIYDILNPVVLKEASSENDLGIIYYPKEGA